ncbi:hypothetical protein ABI59_10645 [Acidobacteria bacterium Mor1]|nr:hypothetical protein ABI59_10645 [Acidobacteria bacterium Mor1]
MKKIATLVTLIVVSALALSTAAMAGAPIRVSRAGSMESVEAGEHLVFGTDRTVDGATILVRDFSQRQVNADISTSSLEADTAYSIWWAVFNHPEFCIEPNACALADLGSLGDPRVRPSVFWAGGFVSDAFGSANHSIRLGVGPTTRELFAKTQPWGLLNLRGAEIHVVLRTHGPVGVAGPVHKQIGTALEACPAGGCANVFASIHRAPTN